MFSAKICCSCSESKPSDENSVFSFTHIDLTFVLINGHCAGGSRKCFVHLCCSFWMFAFLLWCGKDLVIPTVQFLILMARYGAHVNNHVAQKITGGWGKEHVHGCAPRHTKVCQCPQLHTIAYSNVDVGVPWCTLVCLSAFWCTCAQRTTGQSSLPNPRGPR